MRTRPSTESASTPTLEVRRLYWEQLRPAPYNPRVQLQPGDPEYDKLKRSLEVHGYVDPIIWNERTGHIVGGHQRFAIMRDLGIETFDVAVVNLCLEDEKALNIALNKIAGRWDEAKLAPLLTELQALPDFDVTLTGFDLPEIGAVLDHVRPPSADTLDFADLVQDQQPSIIQPGDVVELGPHHLMCGDSTNSQDLTHLLEARQVDLLFTDPPYNVDYYGGDRPKPAGARPKPSRQWARIYNDSLTQAQYATWLGQALEAAVAAMVPGAPFYIWNGHRQFGWMHQLLEELGAHVSCVITWAKESFAIGYGDYNQQTEFSLYGWKPGDGGHRWYGPTNASTLWDVHRDRTQQYRHPTQKPLMLAERAITNSSRRGDVVLDFFLGSGTTLIAADSLERTCYGMELDPHYCDGIVRRFIAHRGLDAVAEPWQSRFAATTGDAA